MDDFEIRALHSEDLRKEREKWFIVARDQREQQELKADKSEEAFMEFAASIILATEIEVQEFHVKLDTYDEATVKALMENTKLLEAINEKIQENLKHAHTLEDGTRAYKSEDGKWGINEHGQRFDGDTHDMETIPSTKVTAEEAEADFMSRDMLQHERTEILEFQEKSDHARERSNSDNFTKDELDGLDKELEAEMPMAVKRQLPNYEPSQEKDLKTDFSASAELSLSEIPKQSINQIIAPTLN